MTKIVARTTSQALSDKVRNAGVAHVIYPKDIDQDDLWNIPEITLDADPEELERLKAWTMVLEDDTAVQVIDMASHARLSEAAGQSLIVPREQSEKYLAAFYLDHHDLTDEVLTSTKEAGFLGVVLDVSPSSDQRLTKVQTVSRIARHVALANKLGLVVALAGNLEEPDVPRLLALDPGYIVLDITSDDDLRGNGLDIFFRSQNVVTRTRTTGTTIVATVADMSAGIRAFGLGASYVGPSASEHFSIGFPYVLNDARFIHVSIDTDGNVSDAGRATIESSKVTFPIAHGLNRSRIPQSVDLLAVMETLKEQGFVAALFPWDVTVSHEENDLALDVFATDAHAAGLQVAMYVVPGQRTIDPATTRADCLVVPTSLPNKEFNGDELTYWVNAAKPRTDRIFVRDILIEMQIGAYGFERGRNQRVRFSVEVEVDRPSVRPEEMDDVYSYDMIMDGVKTLVERGHTDLVETLAEDLADLVLQDPRVHSTVVKVEKLDLGPAAVGIEIRRP